MRRAAWRAAAVALASLLLVSCASTSPVSLTGSPSHTPSHGASAQLTTAAPTGPSGSASTTAGARVTCVPAGSGTPSSTALHRTLDQLRARARSAGLDAQITLRPDGSFRIVSPGSGTVPAARLCADTSITFRPVIVGAQQPQGSSADPTAGLSFALPRDERAYLTLPAAQRKALDSAVRSLRCAGHHATPAPKPVLACDAEANAYLLAVPLVDGNQVRAARAVEPNPSTGNQQWAVQVDLNERGRSAIATYTAAHNFQALGHSPGGSAAECEHVTAPCADYLALVIDGRVQSAPAISTPIPGGSTQITGAFDAARATALAAQLQTPLSVPLRVSEPTTGTASPQPTSS